MPLLRRARAPKESRLVVESVEAFPAECDALWADGRGRVGVPRERRYLDWRSRGDGRIVYHRFVAPRRHGLRDADPAPTGSDGARRGDRARRSGRRAHPASRPACPERDARVRPGGTRGGHPHVRWDDAPGSTAPLLPRLRSIWIRRFGNCAEREKNRARASFHLARVGQSGIERHSSGARWDGTPPKWSREPPSKRTPGSTQAEPTTEPDQSVAALVIGTDSEAFLERCFADVMTTRSTPKADSAFRGSSEAS